MQHCQAGWNIPLSLLLHTFDPNELYMKNGPHSNGLYPLPLSHESSTFITRRRLLAKSFLEKFMNYIKNENFLSQLF